MTKIKCLDLARKIYEEAKIDREFIIASNGLFFTVSVDIAEQNDYNVESFEVADHMFDSLYLNKELHIYLVACDEELAAYYRAQAKWYADVNAEKYFIVTEKMQSADDSILYDWLIKTKTKADVNKYIGKIHDTSFDDIDEMYELYWETNSGNQYSIESIHEISKDHFGVLSKYLIVIN